MSFVVIYIIFQVVYIDPLVRQHVNIKGYGDRQKDIDEFDIQHLNKLFPENTDLENSKWHHFHHHKWVFRNKTWPHINVRFIQRNGTHIWALEEKANYFSLEDYYPLHVRPYMGMWLPAPHHTRHYLWKKYMKKQWQSSEWDCEFHLVTVKMCSKMHHNNPYVIRTEHKLGTIEVLKHSHAILYEAYVDEPWSGSTEV